jgi:hypothetical protein
VKEFIVFEYPEDYWKLNIDDRKIVQEWAVKIMEEIQDPKSKFIKIPPKSTLRTLAIE